MKKLLRMLRDLLFVPRCAGCGERLSCGAGVLCPTCYAAYEMEKARSCPYCGHTFATCHCAGEFLQKNRLETVVKLFQYYPKDAEAVPNRMVYLLKHRAPRPLVELLSEDLAAALSPVLATAKKPILVTFAPRSRAALRRHGFDHMAYLSRAVADRLGLSWRPLLSRRDGGEQKKKLTRSARLANMKNAYTYVGEERLDGYHILLLDDVTTSGATLLAAARTLRRAGARDLTPAVLGATLMAR